MAAQVWSPSVVTPQIFGAYPTARFKNLSMSTARTDTKAINPPRNDDETKDATIEPLAPIGASDPSAYRGVEVPRPVAIATPCTEVATPCIDGVKNSPPVIDTMCGEIQVHNKPYTSTPTCTVCRGIHQELCPLQAVVSNQSDMLTLRRAQLLCSGNRGETSLSQYALLYVETQPVDHDAGTTKWVCAAVQLQDVAGSINSEKTINNLWVLTPAPCTATQDLMEAPRQLSAALAESMVKELEGVRDALQRTITASNKLLPELCRAHGEGQHAYPLPRLGARHAHDADTLAIALEPYLLDECSDVDDSDGAGMSDAHFDLSKDVMLQFWPNGYIYDEVLPFDAVLFRLPKHKLCAFHQPPGTFLGEPPKRESYSYCYALFRADGGPWGQFVVSEDADGSMHVETMVQSDKGGGFTFGR